MKLSDFNKGSDKKSIERLQKKVGRSSKISFVNETQTKSYEDKILKLSEDNSRLNKVLAELETTKIQQQEAISTKKQAEKELSDLGEKFSTMVISLGEYEEREPKIKKVIEQHRELNGQVAELQGKLQVVIEEHDTKVDKINKKITEIDALKKVLHSTEAAANKANQSSIEANMKNDTLQVKLEQAVTKNTETSIIYQQVKEDLTNQKKERNEFEARAKKAQAEKQKAFSSAQRSKELAENYSETLKELASEYYRVSQLNKDLLAEIRKPRFASVASISKREGFKFPISYEPRNNTLGTSKPTLLRKKG
jgi:chromosome segregation ATPase